jgi:Phosphoesterase family
MTKKAVVLGLLLTVTSVLFAQRNEPAKAAPRIPNLKHVFLIIMENHGYGQILNNPNAPFINSYALSANLATNYFAVAHPSLTNYLEVVGGSNFGVLSDNAPDWHDASCATNLSTGIANTSADIVQLYASKHNPFVYFQSVQQGTNPLVSYAQMVPFDGINGLWGDLAANKAPNFSFIVPNQCNDQHGRGNSTAFCNYDPTSNGTQAGLNPALIILGDQEVQRIVTAIHSSKAWTSGNNAIVVVWDENDYSLSPNINQVMTAPRSRLK